MKRSIVVTTVFLMAVILQASVQHKSETADEALTHAQRLLKTIPLIDGHNDLPWAIRENKAAPGNVAAFDLRKTLPGDTDLGRLKEGMVSGQCWSVYIPGETREGFARAQLEQIDIARQMIDHYPELSLALRADDVEAAFRKGRIASLLGMEGGYGLENSLGPLRAYYALGVRYMTLAHNVTLAWADAALGKHTHNGLTPFGKEVVREMNRLGMLVDLSHVTDRVMSDALDVSESPVIFSHSAARAVTNHPRNVPDSILIRLPKNGGVVMVCFVPEFVSQKVAEWEARLNETAAGIGSRDSVDRAQRRFIAEHPMPRATINDVADHIDHICSVVGPDHIGIGSDFAGSEHMPVGLEDVSRFPYLFAELIRRGWNDQDLTKLAGGNFLRVLRQAEGVARNLQKSRPPSSATIEQLDGLKK